MGTGREHGLITRVVAVKVLLAATVATTFGFVLSATAAQRDSEQATRQSLEALDRANELERFVIDLETGVRGFVITSEEQFLAPWNQAREAFGSRAEHLVAVPAGIRAQAVTPDGAMVDDFLIQETDRIINVNNAPSPAATASLNIGKTIVGRLVPRLG